MKESKSGQAFVREIKVLVSLLISDLNQIFVLPPPDSVLRETSLKLNFEYPQLQKIYEKEKMEKYFNDVLFTVSFKIRKFFSLFIINCLFLVIYRNVFRKSYATNLMLSKDV